MGDERLAQICADIYAKHQRALDLIFENKPDRASALAEILHAWAEKKTEEGILTYIPEKSGKTYTRFKTNCMSEILPDSPTSLSGWGTSNYYFYEIRNIGGEEYFIQFAVSSKDIPQELKSICERINERYKSRQQKANWQWRTHFTTKHSKTDDEMSEEKIFEQLDKKLDEINEFEKRLKAYLSLH